MTAPKKPRGRPFEKGHDPRRNTKGASPRDETWKAILERHGRMTGTEIADHIRGIADLLEQGLEDRVTVKEAIVITIYAALLDDPRPGLLSAVIERCEGKVPASIQITRPLEVRGLADILATVYDQQPSAED